MLAFQTSIPNRFQHPQPRAVFPTPVKSSYTNHHSNQHPKQPSASSSSPTGHQPAVSAQISKQQPSQDRPLNMQFERDRGIFRSKIQVAYAKVNVRLIDVKTGQIIFAQEGAGEAKSEAGTSFGVGKHVGYDSTLNDKAISTAISSVVDGIMQNLLNKSD